MELLFILILLFNICFIKYYTQYIYTQLFFAIKNDIYCKNAKFLFSNEGKIYEGTYNFTNN